MAETPASNRERILRAAGEELLAQDGCLEMKAVAQRAGVSVGLAYHHFGSKGGLLAATVDDWFDRLEAAGLDLAFEGDSWAEQEFERIRRYVAFHYEDPLAELMLGRLVTAAEVVGVFHVRMERMIDRGTRNIAKAQRAGEVDGAFTPAITVSVLLGGIRQAIATALASEDRPSADALTVELWTLVVAAVGARTEFEPKRRTLGVHG